MKRPVTPVPLLLLLLLLATLSSCRRDAAFHDALVRAEALMETDPQQARAVLAEIEDSILKIEDYPAEEAGQKTGKNFQFSIFNLQSKKAAADFAWIRTQADYKCDIPLTTDSLARIATDYYSTPRRKNYHAAMAWYTLGCTYMDMQEDLQSIDAFLKAKPLFPDTLNRYYTLCLQNLGKLYTGHYMFSEADRYLRDFNRLCALRNDSALMAHADYLLGKSLMWASRFDEANARFDAVSRNRFTTPRYRHRVMFQKAKIYLHHKHDCDSALHFINAYLSGTSDDPFAGLSVKGDIFCARGEQDSAYVCYKAAASDVAELNTQCNAYRHLAELSSLLKKTDEPIHEYTEKYAVLLDSVFKQAQRDEINTLIRRQEAQLQAAREATAKRTRFFLNLLAAFLIVLFFLVRRAGKLHAESKWQRKKSAIKLEAVEKNAMPEELDETEVVEEAHPAYSVSALETRKALVELCRTKFSAGKWNRLYSLEDATGRMDEKELQELKRTLNRLMDDLQSQLSDDCLNLTRDDIYVCCLSMLGLPKRVIAYCFGTTEHAVYCRYTRLQKKLTPVWQQLVFSKEEKAENA
jgi:hypothetical protein